MGNSWFVLAAIWLLLVEVTLGSSRYRDDGKCGVSNPAPDGLAADCEFIPPFPTCCQSNEHCGWHCDEGTYVSQYISVIQTVCLANVFEMKHIELPNFPTNNIVFLDMLD